MKRMAIMIVATVCFGAFAGSASAQYQAPKNRPFETYNRRPSVSPYMNLINNNTGYATNYQSLVRPQIDQQGYNQRANSAIKNLQRSGGTAASSGPGSHRSASSAEGNLKLRPTGHSTMRQNYSHFFPELSSR